MRKRNILLRQSFTLLFMLIIGISFSDYSHAIDILYLRVPIGKSLEEISASQEYLSIQKILSFLKENNINFQIIDLDEKHEVILEKARGEGDTKSILETLTYYQNIPKSQVINPLTVPKNILFEVTYGSQKSFVLAVVPIRQKINADKLGKRIKKHFAIETKVRCRQVGKEETEAVLGTKTGFIHPLITASIDKTPIIVIIDKTVGVREGIPVWFPIAKDKELLIEPKDLIRAVDLTGIHQAYFASIISTTNIDDILNAGITIDGSPRVGSPAELLRYLHGYRNGKPEQAETIDKKNAKSAKELANKRGGSDGLSTIYRELKILKKAGLIIWDKGRSVYLPEHVLKLTPREIEDIIAFEHRALEKPNPTPEEIKAVAENAGRLEKGYPIISEEPRLFHVGEDFYIDERIADIFGKTDIKRAYKEDKQEVIQLYSNICALGIDSFIYELTPLFLQKNLRKADVYFLSCGIQHMKDIGIEKFSKEIEPILLIDNIRRILDGKSHRLPYTLKAINELGVDNFKDRLTPILLQDNIRTALLEGGLSATIKGINKIGIDTFEKSIAPLFLEKNIREALLNNAFYFGWLMEEIGKIGKDKFINQLMPIWTIDNVRKVLVNDAATLVELLEAINKIGIKKFKAKAKIVNFALSSPYLEEDTVAKILSSNISYLFKLQRFLILKEETLNNAKLLKTERFFWSLDGVDNLAIGTQSYIKALLYEQVLKHDRVEDVFMYRLKKKIIPALKVIELTNKEYPSVGMEIPSLYNKAKEETYWRKDLADFLLLVKSKHVVDNSRINDEYTERPTFELRTLPTVFPINLFLAEKLHDLHILKSTDGYMTTIAGDYLKEAPFLLISLFYSFMPCWLPVDPVIPKYENADKGYGLRPGVGGGFVGATADLWKPMLYKETDPKTKGTQTNFFHSILASAVLVGEDSITGEVLEERVLKFFKDDIKRTFLLVYASGSYLGSYEINDSVASGIYKTFREKTMRFLLELEISKKDISKIFPDLKQKGHQYTSLDSGLIKIHDIINKLHGYFRKDRSIYKKLQDIVEETVTEIDNHLFPKDKLEGKIIRYALEEDWEEIEEALKQAAFGDESQLAVRLLEIGEYLDTNRIKGVLGMHRTIREAT